MDISKTEKDIIQNLKEQNNLKKKQENPTYKYRTDIIEKLEVLKNGN